MAETPSRRPSVRQPWLLAFLVVAVIAMVLLSTIGGDDSSKAPVSARESTPASAPASPTTDEETPDEFCEKFLTFVDANSEYSSRLDVASGDALVEIARDFFTSPTPVGMSPGARTSLDLLVAGTLPQVESAGVTVDAEPNPANDAEPDPDAFDAYLQATCPA